MPTDHAWRVSKAEFERMGEEGLLYWGQNGQSLVPSIKMFLNEARGLTPINYWSHEYAGNTDQGGNECQVLMGAKYFDFPKPTSMMRRVLEHASWADSVVLDFFSGSGSMADAIMQLNADDSGNRQFIMVQLPEVTSEKDNANRDGYSNLCEIGKERIRRAGAKIAAEIEESNAQLKLGESPKPIPDIGFRVFKLDESGINKQDLNATAERGELFGEDALLDSIIKPSRSDMDIVFEMMLKWGLELTLPIEAAQVAGYKCYIVAGGELVCCMEADLTVEALETIAKKEPRRVLMLDSILTDTLKLNAVQIFKRVGDHTGVEVELRTV